MAIEFNLGDQDEVEVHDEDVEPCFLSVSFTHAQQQNLTVVKSCSILFQSWDNHQCWKWQINLESFEVVHGLFRLVRIIPVYLAHALQANENPLQNRDGTFFVDLVLNLTINYMNMVRPVITPFDLNQEVSFVNLGREDLPAPPVAGVPLNLRGVIMLLRTELHSFCSSLPDHSPDLVQQTRPILGLCDDVLKMCQVYLILVHPLWRRVNRVGEFSEDLFEPFKRTLLHSFVLNENRSSTIFSAEFN